MKSPFEFYDEELSRTIRLIQQTLVNVEQGATTLSELDKLFNSATVFVRQMQMQVDALSPPPPTRQKTKKKPKNDADDETTRQQWMEILQFRRDTLAILATERAKIHYKAVSSSSLS